MADTEEKIEAKPESEAKPTAVPEVKPQVEAKPEVEAKPAPEPVAKPEPSDWREARIAKLTGQLREAQEKLQAAQAKPQAESEKPGLTQADVEARARELAASEAFNSACAAEAMKGREAFADFDSKVGEIGRRLVTANDPVSQAAHMALVQAALQTGKAHEVLYHLGSDLNEAARLMSLSPLAMAVEVAKLGFQPKGEASKAPKPITPVGAKGPSHEEISPDDPDRGSSLTTAEWMRRREAQVGKRNEARGR